MMWMGLASAWGAAAMAALFAVNAFFQFATGVSGWVYALTAVTLLTGAWRTLRQMSGGLRLLAGAWGLAAGVQMLPITAGAAPSPLALALIALCLAGMALTVLHQEKKKA